MTTADRTPPVPMWPDPTVAGEALSRLMATTAQAMQTTTAKAMSGEPLPYDPTTLGRAIVEFNTAMMTQPAALAQAQAKAWTEWTALWRAMGETALGGTPSRWPRR